MKKKNKFLAFCCAGIVGALMFLPTIGVGQMEVKAEESASTAVATPIKVELNVGEENELWKGDIIYFEHGAWGTPTNGIYSYDIEIVEGDSVEIFDRWSEKQDGTKNLVFLGIKCVKTGKSTINVNFTDEEGKPGVTTYIINVVEGEEIVYSDMDISVNIGDIVDFKVENMRYGSIPFIEPVNFEDTVNFARRDYSGGVGVTKRNDFSVNYPMFQAVFPGEIPYKFYDAQSDEVYATGTIKIEEPVIETNAPQIIGLGTNLDLETKLVNVVGLSDAYEPKITIIEGNDCVKNTQNEYTSITTSDTLEFVKAGTVKISIKYEADVTAIEIIEPGVYASTLCSAEKVITIKVADKDEEIVQDIESEDVTIITKETLLSSYKNNNLMSINVTDDGKLLYSWQFAPKDESTIVNVDLKVDMGVEDKQVAELASRFDPYVIRFSHHGKLPDNTNIKVLVPDTFDDVKAFVYHLEEDGTATLTYEGMVEDGYISMPLEHCSTYFITKEKIESVENETEEVTTESSTTDNNVEETTTKSEESKAPNTGDNHATTVYIVILAIALGVLAIIGRKKATN